MIKTRLFTQNEVRQDVPLEDWQSLVKDSASLLWVDARSLSDDDLHALAGYFNLHDIAIESCTDRYRRPHLYEFGDHFYINMTVLKQARSNGIKPTELHVFAGKQFIITATKEASCEAVDAALRQYEAAPEICQRGPLCAVYLLAQDLVESYYPIIEKLDDSADKVENQLLTKADKATLKRNLDLKHETFELRKLLGPQRDIFSDLARRQFSFIADESCVYFEDIYNRMIRIFDMLDTVREILTSNLDIYLSSVSNRLNDIMKVLTVFAVILGVLSFITGWFGMNVFTDNAIKMSVREVFAWSLAIGAVITGGLMYWFRRKGWM